MHGEKLMIKFDKLVSNFVANNPYFEDWSCSISSPGDIGSCKIPMKKDLPDTIRMKGNVEYAGSTVIKFDITFCEAFENEEFAKDILNHGIPKGKFPQQCPVKAGMDYEISKYKFPKEKLPPVGLPDGDFSGDIHLYEPGKDPYASVNFEGKVFNELPKIPGFGR
ncbi:uncharacterized protein LOC103573729 isoform X2 [Microplitis demolitor]|uniref:uncharacterized protein LOC103573729 isoform X2 n=1 Tax=Microplitis demolitor TaxID=69319 RepID=UPI00235B6302|nr:uncharacterized protein LOC103573729 isoform X2 [Microplitis demolitor]